MSIIVVSLLMMMLATSSLSFQLPNVSSPPPPTSTSSQDLNSFGRRSFLATGIAGVVSPLLFPSIPANAAEDSSGPIANFAQRRVGSLPASLTNLPPNRNGIFVRFGEQILFSNDASRTPGKDVFAQFDFPADWLQLDRMLGGVQYVDQRNGDKLYLLKVPLPDGMSSLKEVPKSYFGEAIFNPKGELIRTGNNVEEFKVLSSQMIGEQEEGASAGPTRRRLKIRYTTLTGNNFSVERKGLVDIYEFGGMCYMLMTGSNAVLFDKKGRERDVVENIVDSFRVVPV